MGWTTKTQDLQGEDYCVIPVRLSFSPLSRHELARPAVFSIKIEWTMVSEKSSTSRSLGSMELADCSLSVLDGKRIISTAHLQVPWNLHIMLGNSIFEGNSTEFIIVSLQVH